MKKTGLIVATAVLALAVAGTAWATSPAQYRQQATAICQGTSAKLKKVKQPLTTRDFQRYLKETLPFFQAQYAALKKLTPPRALRYLHGKALTAERKQIDGVAAWIRELELGANPQTAYNTWKAKLQPVSKAEDAAWSKLRLPACKSL